MNKIIIEIRGGCFTGVTTDTPIEATLVDWDNIKEGSRPFTWTLTPVEGDVERRLQEIDEELKGSS